MRIDFANIDFSDLHGDLLADYLIAIDADLKIVDGSRTIFEEPDFPVVELARSLASWLDEASGDDFEFVSQSTDERGIVTIAREADDWLIFSSFTPELRSSGLRWVELAQCVREFIDAVRAELTVRGLSADRIVGAVPHVGGDS